MSDPDKEKSVLEDIKHKITIKESHPHHHHINLLLVIVIFLIIVLALVIRPAFIGYKISKQFEEVGMGVSEFIKQMDSVRSDLLVSNTNLESCKSLNQEYLNNFAAEKNETFRCSQEKNELQSRYNQLSSDFSFNLTRIKSDFEQKKNEIQLNLTQLESKYSELKLISDAVTRNAANNICCKAKVDNKNIDSYIISNGVIVCTTGEQNKITC